MQPYGPAVLRLAAGAVFMAHGAQKLFGVWGGGGPAGTAAFFTQLGLIAPFLLALLVGVVDFVGGLMLILGAYTPAAAATLVLKTALAVWTLHFENGFFLSGAIAPGRGHGYEFDLLLLGALVSLMLTGPGALSIDSRRARSAEAEAFGRARVRAGNV